MTHICVSKLTIVGSDNGLSPGRRQSIMWTNAWILIGALGTNFSEISIETDAFSFMKIHLKMWSGKWWPICIGPNVLNEVQPGLFSRIFFLLQTGFAFITLGGWFDTRMSSYHCRNSHRKDKTVYYLVKWHESRIFYPSGHWPETLTNAHVSAHFR